MKELLRLFKGADGLLECGKWHLVTCLLSLTSSYLNFKLGQRRIKKKINKIKAKGCLNPENVVDHSVHSTDLPWRCDSMVSAHMGLATLISRAVFMGIDMVFKGILVIA